MPQRYCSHVEITAHAHGRWRLRAPGQDEPGPKQILRLLNGKLRGGVEVDEILSLWVAVSDRLSAICMPLTGAEGGGWRVVTYKFHGAWARYDREEKAL